MGRPSAFTIPKLSYQKELFLPLGNHRDKVTDFSVVRALLAIFPLAETLASQLDHNRGKDGEHPVGETALGARRRMPRKEQIGTG